MGVGINMAIGIKNSIHVIDIPLLVPIFEGTEIKCGMVSDVRLNTITPEYIRRLRDYSGCILGRHKDKDKTKDKDMLFIVLDEIDAYAEWHFALAHIFINKSVPIDLCFKAPFMKPMDDRTDDVVRTALRCVTAFKAMLDDVEDNLEGLV